MNWGVVLGTSIVVSASLSETAFACTCVPTTTEELYDHAEQVFEGVAQGKMEREFTGGLAPFRMSFSVTRAWKGSESGNVEVRMHDFTCGFDFEDGRTYVVFARKDHHHHLPGLWTYRCLGTALATDAKDVIEDLDRLALRRRQLWGWGILVAAAVIAMTAGALVSLARRRRLASGAVPQESKR